jgi:hypothetical protein
MATLTLVLGVFGYGQMQYDRKQQEDWIFIESTMNIFKRVSTEPFGKVAGQCYHALLELTSFYGSEAEADQTLERKVVIPFFGTISLQISAKTIGSELGSKLQLLDEPRVCLPMNPEIVYDGPYAQSTSDQRSSFGTRQSFGDIQPPVELPKYGNFDLDQNWNWLPCDVSDPTILLQ